MTFKQWLKANKKITLQEFYDTSEARQWLLENEYKEYKSKFVTSPQDATLILKEVGAENGR